MSLEVSELQSYNTPACMVCGVLGGSGLDGLELVVRMRDEEYGPFRLFCAEHAPLNIDSEYLRKAACGRCDRRVYVDVDFRWPVYCCESCRTGAANARAWAKQLAARPTRLCVACEGSLLGLRRDAEFCSAACRQWAHRVCKGAA